MSTANASKVMNLIVFGNVEEACQHAIWRLGAEQLPALLASEHGAIREAAQDRLRELI